MEDAPASEIPDQKSLLESEQNPETG